VVAVPLAVVLFGKARGERESGRISLGQGMGAGQWVLKLGATILLYELLYSGFGYYVAWKNPAVLAFYQGTDPDGFVVQMRNVVSETPTVLGLQAFRALLWAACALPVVDMLEDKPWIGALATGLLLRIPANVSTSFPTPTCRRPCGLRTSSRRRVRPSSSACSCSGCSIAPISL
jgi:hypothetical protein